MVELAPAVVEIIRHGQTEFHGSKRVAGGMTDVPLNQTGKGQAVDLAVRRRSRRYTGIDASPLSRAVDFVRPLAIVQGIHEVTRVPALRERSFGIAFEEETDEAVLAVMREQLDAFWQLPPYERMDAKLVHDMETDRQLLGRVYPYLRRQPSGARVVAGSHWDVISTLTLHETGLLISPDNTGSVTVEIGLGEITIINMQGCKEILNHST